MAGLCLAGDYNALAAGAGWDLQGVPGTLSADITQSVARTEGERTFLGKSRRLSYPNGLIMRMPTLRSRVSFLRAKLYDHGAVPERPLP